MINIAIKQVRKSHGLTQKDFADLLGVSRSAVGNWESGYCEPPIEVLMKISNKFCVSLDELIGTNYYERNIAEIKLISIYRGLNNQGKSKMIERAEELTEIMKYSEKTITEKAD